MLLLCVLYSWCYLYINLEFAVVVAVIVLLAISRRSPASRPASWPPTTLRLPSSSAWRHSIRSGKTKMVYFKVDQSLKDLGIQDHAAGVTG